MTTTTRNGLRPSYADKVNAKRESSALAHAPEVREIHPGDLVPGDRFAARGSVWTVTGFPDSGVARLTSVPVAERTYRLEYAAGRTILAWQHRTVSYGHARCPGCSCHVDRDHAVDSEECIALQGERRAREEERARDW